MASMTKRLLIGAASALLLLAATPLAAAVDEQPPQPSVVVRVEGGGFHWEDAAVGGMATLAAGLLVLGLFLTFRVGRRTR